MCTVCHVAGEHIRIEAWQHLVQNLATVVAMYHQQPHIYNQLRMSYLHHRCSERHQAGGRDAHSCTSRDGAG